MAFLKGKALRKIIQTAVNKTAVGGKPILRIRRDRGEVGVVKFTGSKTISGASFLDKETPTLIRKSDLIRGEKKNIETAINVQSNNITRGLNSIFLVIGLVGLFFVLK